MTGYEAGLRDVAADVLGRPHQGVLPRLYRNRRGVFHDALFINPGNGQHFL